MALNHVWRTIVSSIIWNRRAYCVLLDLSSYAIFIAFDKIFNHYTAQWWSEIISDFLHLLFLRDFHEKFLNKPDEVDTM